MTQRCEKKGKKKPRARSVTGFLIRSTATSHVAAARQAKIHKPVLSRVLPCRGGGDSTAQRRGKATLTENRIIALTGDKRPLPRRARVRFDFD